MPDFESGYHLASYKCVCKANYEFPFIDYGSSYFEGGTVEKEYDKKVRGLPNIYDRLKCRPVTLRNSYGRQQQYNLGVMNKSNLESLLLLLFLLINHFLY